MSGCYYCGKTVRYQCDFLGVNRDGVFEQCERETCADCCVPEFQGGSPAVWALCKGHAWAQKARVE
jgi:hypothetical protein